MPSPHVTTFDRSPVGQPQWEQREDVLLAPYAMFAKNSAGREIPEPEHAYRSPFQRDRDRILHSAAFRRLSGKMQVFTGDMGDYHRTRLTHTHEVATIARTIGRVLRLNEDLIEALALLHDIGHPPFGHSGEDALSQCLGSAKAFSHNRFALTLVQELETRYTDFPGLNLSKEILDGQDFRITHQGETPLLEVQVVDLADSIAYNAHDADDALKLGLLDFEQLQSLQLVTRALHWLPSAHNGSSQRARSQLLVHHLIDIQVADLLEQATGQSSHLTTMTSRLAQRTGIRLEFSAVMQEYRREFSQFLFDHVYRHPQLVAVRRQASAKIQDLFNWFVLNPHGLPTRFLDRSNLVGLNRAISEYIAGMTDRFCSQQHHRLVVQDEGSARDWH